MQRTQRGLHSVAEETSSSEGTEKPSQALSFAFFAPSRETNLLSKFAPFGGCTRRRRNFLKRRHGKAITSFFLRVLRAFA
jgi:hypothetical protein